MNIDFNNDYSVNFDILSDGVVDFSMDGQTGGTTDYNKLTNKPSINAVELIGNKTSDELYLQDKMDTLTNNDIEELLNNFV